MYVASCWMGLHSVSNVWSYQSISERNFIMNVKQSNLELCEVILCNLWWTVLTMLCAIIPIFQSVYGLVFNMILVLYTRIRKNPHRSMIRFGEMMRNSTTSRPDAMHLVSDVWGRLKSNQPKNGRQFLHNRRWSDAMWQHHSQVDNKTITMNCTRPRVCGARIDVSTRNRTIDNEQCSSTKWISRFCFVRFINTSIRYLHNHKLYTDSVCILIAVLIGSFAYYGSNEEI